MSKPDRKYRGLLIPGDQTNLLGRGFDIAIIAVGVSIVVFGLLVFWKLFA